MSGLSDDDLAELERLEKAATAAPWAHDNVQSENCVLTGYGSCPLAVPWGATFENAAFIAAARNALGPLLEEVRRLRAAMLPTGNIQEMSATGNIATAKAEGAREERAKIVEWLRLMFEERTCVNARADLNEYARCIERGDHDRSDGDG